MEGKKESGEWGIRDGKVRAGVGKGGEEKEKPC